MICYAFADALLGWALVRKCKLKDKYKSALTIIKPRLIFRDYVSMLDNFTDFFRGMSKEFEICSNEEKLNKTIDKYKNQPLNHKRYKKAIALVHYDDGLSKNPHTAFTSFVKVKMFLIRHWIFFFFLFFFSLAL